MQINKTILKNPKSDFIAIDLIVNSYYSDY